MNQPKPEISVALLAVPVATGSTLYGLHDLFCSVGRVGYQDGSFFRRLFRRRVGMTPAEYRRRYGFLRDSLLPLGRAHGPDMVHSREAGDNAPR